MFAELNGYITANDYEQYQLAVTDLFKGRWMSLVALVIYSVFIGYRFSPEKPVLKMENGTDLAAKNQKTEVLSPAKERCGYLLFFLVSLALIFNTQLNAGLQAVGLAPLASWEIVLAGAVLMVVSGVLSSKEAFAAVPWDSSQTPCAHRCCCRKPWQPLSGWCGILSGPFFSYPDHAEPYSYGNLSANRHSRMQEHGCKLRGSGLSGGISMLYCVYDSNGNCMCTDDYGYRRL